jgi:hypothetical protein
MIVVIWTSGCITNTPNQTNQRTFFVVTTGKSLSLDRNEVLKINFSEAQHRFQEKGYEFKNQSYGNVTEYVATMMGGNLLYPILKIWIDSTPNESWIQGYYDSERPINESKLNETKQYILDKLKETADVCNLTVNWTQVRWSITYAD